MHKLRENEEVVAMSTTAQSVRNRKNKAKTTFTDFIEKDRENIFVIHYSCESFLFKPQGTHTRIAAVAVRNLSGTVRKVYSIHSAAAIASCREDEIQSRLIDLEKDFLDELFKFFASNINASWMHWNMNSDKFGFDALQSRYNVLFKTQPTIPELGRRFNLASNLKDRFGNNYACEPHLDNAMRLNGLSDIGFLPGGVEAVAVDNHKYKEVHDSTEAKINVIAELAKKLQDNKFHSHASFWDRYGTDFPALVDDLMGTFVMKLLGLLALLSTILAIVKSLIHPSH